MKDLFEILPIALGSDVIRQCWGDVPPFAYGDVLHVRQRNAGDEQALVLTFFCMTQGPEDANQCKPSRLVVEFERVVHWEYTGCDADQNGIALDDILRSPPVDTAAINVDHTFYVVCHGVRVLSCVPDPFDDYGPE